MATQRLDATGLNCPLPVLRTKKAIKALNVDDTLEVLSTDPGSAQDMPAFCKATGNELVESGEDGGVFRFLIRKQG